MLYERWQQVVRGASNERAVWEAATGRTHTFGDLARRAEAQPRLEGVFRIADQPGLDFILSVLGAWRDRQVVVPLEPGRPHPPLQAPPGGGVVHLKTTSATTGPARMIAFDAEQLAADCEQVVSTMGLDAAHPNVGALSLAHSYGFSNLVLPLLLKGIPLLLSSSALPESVRVAVAQAPSVALPSVPALWRAWHDAGILTDRVRIAISAGAPLGGTLERSVFESAGIKIHNFYGSSECGGIAYDRTDVPRADPASVGSPMDGVNVSVDPDGCVRVRSRAVGRGYWPESDETLGNGSFKTGDLGELVNGRLYLKGRASDLLNVAGRKVLPEEIEQALSGHPCVRDCLVFGAPGDDARNDRIVACVALDPQVATRELAEFLRERLPAWQLPREWWVVESLDVNRFGKRSRPEWRERFLARQGESSRA